MLVVDGIERRATTVWEPVTVNAGGELRLETEGKSRERRKFDEDGGRELEDGAATSMVAQSGRGGCVGEAIVVCRGSWLRIGE
ncbi:hypothetical protein RYX36_025156 [Vicia faba]